MRRLGDIAFPKRVARYAGMIYLLIIAGGIFAQVGVRAKMVVAGNPAATAQNIIDHELLYRAGFAIEVFYLLWGIPLKFFLYDLFKVVHRKAALPRLEIASSRSSPCRGLVRFRSASACSSSGCMPSGGRRTPFGPRVFRQSSPDVALPFAISTPASLLIPAASPRVQRLHLLRAPSVERPARSIHMKTVVFHGVGNVRLESELSPSAAGGAA